MKRLRKKLKSDRGLTLIEMVVGTGILALLGLMLSTGLFLARDSYNNVTEESETQLLLSTLSNLLSNELRYARDITATAGKLEHYTSANYGSNTKLEIDNKGQLRANGLLMLSTGAYGNGVYKIESCDITFQKAGSSKPDNQKVGGDKTETAGNCDLFHVELEVKGVHEISNKISFSVRCLNQTRDEGGNT